MMFEPDSELSLSYLHPADLSSFKRQKMQMAAKFKQENTSSVQVKVTLHVVCFCFSRGILESEHNQKAGVSTCGKMTQISLSWKQRSAGSRRVWLCPMFPPPVDPHCSSDLLHSGRSVFVCVRQRCVQACSFLTFIYWLRWCLISTPHAGGLRLQFPVIAPQI